MVTLNSRDIEDLIPHRYPMLMVDRILECDDRARIVGLKNLTVNEPFFQGHFPGAPIMPGVLQLEAMAQVGGLLYCRKSGTRGILPLFLGVDKARFRRPIGPGDQMRIEVDLIQERGRVIRCRGVVRVDGQPASEAELMFMATDRTSAS